MKQGFIKVAAATPKIRVADTVYNTEVICDCISKAIEEGAKVIVLPELAITGYTCVDLFLQDKLLSEAKEALFCIAAFTQNLDGIVFVGLPIAYGGKLYNVAAAISRGQILGFVPKSCIPNYNEFYEGRYFNRGMERPVEVELADGSRVPMGTKLLFICREMPELVIAAEICEDLWSPEPPSSRHARNGATVIVNLSASNEITGKDIYRRNLVTGQSARLLCGYVYASAGEGESTQDVVFSGHNMIAENYRLLGESRRFENEIICSEIDLQRILAERRRMSSFEMLQEEYHRVGFSLKVEEIGLTRFIDPMPFVPQGKAEREKRCEEILAMQAVGLKKRLEHTNCKTAVIGISGGLDSTLALLVTVRAFDMLGMDRKGITALIYSVTKFDLADFPNGSVLDVVLHPSAVMGEEGLDAFYALLMTYFRMGGFALHGNVFSAEDLKRAQREPERYKNLQVRVCGWNAYFVNLSQAEQEAFIRQAENNVR